MQMITIQDVARRSGVSATTVSHVINKTRYVRPELADRVMRAVEELGYTPLRVSHRQKLCGMRVAGIFLSSIRGSYASDLADCLAAELLDKRVRIVAIVTEQRLAWKDFLEYVRLYHLDTAIVHYSVEIRDDGGAPPPVQTIFINHIPTERDNCYYINFDYPHAVGLALRHLLNRGHADIAFLACQSSSFINQSVLSAAHETCRQYGLAFDDGHFWTIDDTYSRDELVRQLGACFQAHPGITAVITAETGATMHIMDYIRLNDLQFPQDLSLITIGDMYIAKVFFPNITRVDMKVRELVAGIRELILGGNERRDLAAAVELIALLEGVEGLVDLGLELLGGKRLGVVLVALQHTATGTLARVGGQEDLDLCVGEHDGSDVATLGDDIAVLGGAALVDEHGGAHARVGRDLGHVGVDLRGANGGRCVLAVDGQARVLAGAVGKADLDLLGEGVNGRLVVQVDAAVERGEGDGAIHGARVELVKAQLAGNLLGDGGLAGTGGAVDGDDHAMLPFGG